MMINLVFFFITIFIYFNGYSFFFFYHFRRCKDNGINGDVDKAFIFN